MSKEDASNLEQQRQSLVNETQKLPGIPELMDVYNGWRQVDQGHDAYRSIETSSTITASDHTTPR